MIRTASSLVFFSISKVIKLGLFIQHTVLIYKISSFKFCLVGAVCAAWRSDGRALASREWWFATCARKCREIYPCQPKKLRNLLNLLKRDCAKESPKNILSGINEESERVSCRKSQFLSRGILRFFAKTKDKTFRRPRRRQKLKNGNVKRFCRARPRCRERRFWFQERIRFFL